MTDDSISNAISILVVEDSPTQVRVIKEAIEATESLRLLESVETADDAIDYLKGRGDYTDSESPQLVIVDFNLPQCNGSDLLAKMRSDPDLESMPVIILFGLLDDEEVDRARKLGANTCIEKPITVEDFFELFEVIGSYWSLAIR